MTISVKQISTDMQTQWDDFVNQHPDATPYHMFAWGASIKQSYGFKCYFFVAIDNDVIKGILPIVAMRSLGGKKHLCALPYCDVGGILSDTPYTAELLKTYVTDFAIAKNIADIELRGSASSLLAPSDAPEHKKVRMILSLPNTADELMAQFKSKLRSQIRKAQKNGLTAAIINGAEASPKNIGDFYDVLAANMRDLGSPVHSLVWYEAIIENYRANMFLAIIKKDDIVVGAGLVLKNGTRASIPWASTLKEYNHLASNMLLYWTVLEECCQQQVRTFDFGRSTVGEGTFNFKKQWGCQANVLEWETFTNSETTSTMPSQVSKTRELVESIWRHMPLGITKIIGPKLRKYISL